MHTPLKALHRQVWTAMMAALIVVGAMIQIPIGPVPVTLHTLFILLSGLVLGPVQGAAAMLLYLLAGAIGLPVFSGGKAGVAHLFGPTGGYLIGYVGTAFLAGFGSVRYGDTEDPASIFRCLLWCFVGLACVFAVGVLRLKFVLDIPFEKAIAIGFAPFIIGDVIKAVAAVFAYRFLFYKRLLPS